MGINNRLDLFVKYKTGGKYKEFADMIGWNPQYLYSLLKGKSFGYKPIETLLKKFPELDARWLILGEGEMLLNSYSENIIKKNLIRIIDIEKLIPYMSSEQLKRISNGSIKFTDDELNKLREKSISEGNGT